MDFSTLICTRKRCLGEGSIFEKLRRDTSIEVDPEIFHAALIYDEHGAQVLERAHRDYLDIGHRLGLPTIVVTDTWRANFERIKRSRFRDRRVNEDDTAFIRRIADDYVRQGMEVYVGGQTGPRGDAYKPAEALSAEDALEFHRPQMEALCNSGVDFLLAATLPALSEARGIAEAMAETGKPYALSFVVRRNGTILDGTPLVDAVRQIDDTSSAAPTAYFVNCVYPTIFAEALDAAKLKDPDAAARIFGFYANTSDLDPEDLDGSEELLTVSPTHLADLMLDIHERHDIPILGGCCGTDIEHIQKLGNTFQT
ncbi:MAG: homocysteine S-methyltransferase family protein [Rhodovibrionaceae bacterium]|nr:homocysteine S-methyltransferase family protein [Rhodovibrionaceae bacterium]